MAKKKPGVMMYFDLLPRFKKLTFEQCGRITIAIMEYAQDGIVPEFDDAILSIYWDFIKEKVDKDDEAYTRKCEKARRAATGRWDKEREANADAYERIQAYADAYERIEPHTNESERMRSQPTTTTTTSTTSPTTTTTTSTPSTNSPVPNDKGLAEVMDYFLNKINPTAPQFVLDKIKFYYQQMGVDCCKRAFDIALAERKTSWSYIDTILKNKLSQGVKCLADWEESDKKHEDGKRAKAITKNPGKATAQDFQPTDDEIQENNDWLKKFLAENGTSWRGNGEYGT